MVAALDSATGKQIWKTYALPDPPSKRTAPDGKTYMGPAGVGVWGPATIDPKQNALYIGTGNTFSGPDVGRSDAVMAINLDTGKILWVKQDEPERCLAHWMSSGTWACRLSAKALSAGSSPARTGAMPPPPPPNYYCPDPEGPDWDIASGAMLATFPDGHRLLVAGQKSGLVWGQDPDKKGEVVWRSRIDIPRGQIVFGGAMDNDTAYFAFRSGGVDAINIADGKEKWYTPVDSPATWRRTRALVPQSVLFQGLSSPVDSTACSEPSVLSTARRYGTSTPPRISTRSTASRRMAVPSVPPDQRWPMEWCTSPPDIPDSRTVFRAMSCSPSPSNIRRSCLNCQLFPKVEKRSLVPAGKPPASTRRSSNQPGMSFGMMQMPERIEVSFVPAEKEKIAVIGAGFMGPGIGQVFASCGHPVQIFNRSPERLAEVHERIRGNLSQMADYGLADADQIPSILRPDHDHDGSTRKPAQTRPL